MAKKQRPLRPSSRPASGALAFSLTAVARECGISRDRLGLHLSRVDAEPISTGAGHVRYRLRDVVRALAGANAVEAMSPFERLAMIRVEREQIALRQQAGELVPVEEVREEFAWIVKTTLRVLTTLPDVLERDTGAAPAQVEAAERAIDGLRRELYERMGDERRDVSATPVALPAEVES